MKVNDAPLFMKSVSALLVLTYIAELLSIFITVLDSEYLKTSNMDIALFLLIQAIFCFVMIWLIYGMMIRIRWCYVLWLILTVVNIAWIIFNINNAVEYVLSAILLIDMAILIAVPRVRRYCLGKDMPVQEDVSEKE